MPIFVQTLLGSTLRWALGLLAGFLVQHGVITGDQTADFVLKTVAVLLPILLSILEKVAARQKLLTALSLSSATTEHAVTQMVADGGAPPLLTDKHDVPVALPK